MSPPIRRRRTHRLPPDAYVGTMAAHVTIVTGLRERLFEDPRLAQACLEALEQARSKHDATLHAYCVMPDHVHLLVEVPGAMSLEKFMRLFKQLAGYRIKQLTGEPAWQISYHDRILRREESLLDVAAYIWENPVKAGLVESRSDYPFSGPLEHLQPS